MKFVTFEKKTKSLSDSEKREITINSKFLFKQILIWQMQKRKSLLYKMLGGGQNTKWHFFKNDKKSIFSDYSEIHLWRMNLLKKILNPKYLSSFFNHLKLSPRQALVLLMPWIENSISSFDEVINHLFFFHLYGFQQSDIWRSK